MPRSRPVTAWPTSFAVWRHFATALVIIALFATACTDSDTVDGDPPTNAETPTDTSDGAGSAATASGATVQFNQGPGTEPETRITIELGDGSPDQGAEVPRETTVDGTALSSADTALLLARLADLDEEASDRTDFSRPPETRPAPLPGETVEQSFPPDADGPDTPDGIDPGALEVLRFQPEGPVDLAPFISVTFNQPMIALGTVDQVEQSDIGITVTPEMPGRWIWIGARTLRFEYEPGAIDRIPASTNYEVTVPAGTESINGATLDDEVSFTFTTPTARVVDVTPMSNSLSTEPLFFIEFDQRIDAEATLAKTDLRVGGSPVDLVLASETEILEDEAVARRAERALVDRFMVVRPVEPLETDANVALRVGPNIVSLEGPETSDETFSFDGSTYGRLQVTDVDCGFGQGCQPGQQFRIQMSNPLDPAEFTADQVVIEPALPGARIGVEFASITIQGATKGQTTYTITLKSDLVDTFGQQLGEDVTRSIDVGDADPALFRPGRTLVTLDPIVGDQRLNVSSINNDRLDVTVYAVNPTDDWTSFAENNWQLAFGDWEPGWTVLDERVIDAGGERNEFAETAIDLSAELADSNGHLVVLVAPEQRRNDEWRNEPFAVWVQNTTIGLDAVSDNAKAIAWVTDLRTGEALDGANVSLLPGSSDVTNSEGIAELQLGRNSRGLLAEVDGQQALIGDFWAEAWQQDDWLRWYVVDDRGIYRPGETANIKGWLRLADAANPADLTMPEPGTKITWAVRDNVGNQLATGESEINDLAGFDFAVELPEDINLGFIGIEFEVRNLGNNSFHFHELRVEEFRRPDFEVTVETQSPEPRFVDEVIGVHANADYFATGPLAGSQVEWFVSARPTSYSPPNWPEYDFGIWVPWWFGGFGDFESDFGFGGSGFSPGESASFSATTDASGGHDLDMNFSIDGKVRPIMVDANATVFDVNRQGISGSTSTLVHPADLYVGLRSDRAFVEPGETLSIEVIATDLDGALVPDQAVSIASTRLEWRFEGGSWSEVPVPSESCEVTTNGDGPTLCEFTPDQGGRYRVAATIVDSSGRSNITELTRWVAGGTRPQNRAVSLEQVTIIPDGETWQPGDRAELLVQSPFSNAHGLAVISRSGIDRTQSFDFDESGTAVLQIPIADDDVPGIGVQVEVVGTAPRTSTGEADDELLRPAFASGQITLPVPADARRLTVDVAPRLARLEPGEATSLDVRVTNADGEPVEDAELLVIVVDEAVLSLTGYQLGDPLDRFYPNNGFFTQAQRGRSTIRLSDPFVESQGGGDAASGGALAEGDDALVEEAAMDDDEQSASDTADFAAPQAPAAELRSNTATALTQGEGGEASKSIDLRTNFDPLAVFEPEVRTNADGAAIVEVPLPDNLTRYRVMVAAVADATDGGTGDSNITARLPITVRPTPPRFANFGDQFEFPVVVQNATDEELDVEVALRTTNLKLDEGQSSNGVVVTVPGNDRVEVRFDVAADQAGTARWQVAASAGEFADAAEGELPIYTPATAEAFATYGIVDQGVIAQPLTEPQDVFAQFGGLEISTSSTAVSALTDAVLYLSEYRYDSSDAFASRIMAIVALDDLLESFDADELPEPDDLRAVVNRDLDRLTSMQNDDGGFPSWRRGRESIPYNSVQATHAMVLARDNGLPVSDRALQSALQYVTNVRDNMPEWYSTRTRTAIEAYALHVRFLAGDRDIDNATDVFTRRGDDQLDVAAWLWPILDDTPADDEIELLLANRVTETPNAATFATDYGEDNWLLLHSDRRTDAIVLDALLRQRPDSDLIDKTLNGLLASRGRRGHWTNVQENAFVLLAGSRFFDERESEDPDFIARVWLGDTYAVEQPYEGRSTVQTTTLVPMATLLSEGDSDIVVARDGDEGRLYYRLGLRYAPDDLELEPRDQGFVVARTYEAIDDAADVTFANGEWTVRAGARVRVRLTMIADSRRTHVALIDPMPAGFESVNPTLATSEPVPPDDATGDEFRSDFWWYRWFDHQNLRDDRAEAFATWLGAGSYEYTYVARATTPGTFVVPPTRAEQIYEPEVFGRSATTTVKVAD